MVIVEGDRRAAVDYGQRSIAALFTEVIRYCNRPFSSIEEMDQTLIDNWNTMVDPKDTIYHLGDFCFGGPEEANHYITQLNGKIHFLWLPWHHDRRWHPDTMPISPPYASKSGYQVTFDPPMHILKLPEYGDDRHAKTLALSHYAIARWDCMKYGAWHLYGHSHGNFENGGLSFDVGVDCNDFRPISLDEVAERMEERGRSGV